MAEYHNAKTDYILKIDGAYENTTNTDVIHVVSVLSDLPEWGR